MTFQQTVNQDQAPAVAGDFCDENPRMNAISPSGAAFVAGVGGLTVGLFAWADTSTGMILLNAGSGLPTGFVHREYNALVTGYLVAGGLLIPAGFGVGSLFSAGGFWMKNTGAGAVTIGMKAFASNTTGQVQFAATGATVAGYTETKWVAWSKGATLELIKTSATAIG